MVEKLRHRLDRAKRAVGALRAKAVLQGKDPSDVKKKLVAPASSSADSPKPSPTKSGMYMGMRIAPPWDIKLGDRYDILDKKCAKAGRSQAALSAAVHIEPECSTFPRVRE